MIDYPKNHHWLIDLRKGINIFPITVPFLSNLISTIILLLYTIGRKQVLENFTDNKEKKSFALLFIQEI